MWAESDLKWMDTVGRIVPALFGKQRRESGSDLGSPTSHVPRPSISTLLTNHPYQVNAPVGIPPLVVVPPAHLYQRAVDHVRAECIQDAAVRVADIVR